MPDTPDPTAIARQLVNFALFKIDPGLDNDQQEFLRPAISGGEIRK